MFSRLLQSSWVRGWNSAVAGDEWKTFTRVSDPAIMLDRLETDLANGLVDLDPNGGGRHCWIDGKIVGAGGWITLYPVAVTISENDDWRMRLAKIGSNRQHAPDVYFHCEDWSARPLVGYFSLSYVARQIILVISWTLLALPVLTILFQTLSPDLDASAGEKASLVGKMVLLCVAGHLGILFSRAYYSWLFRLPGRYIGDSKKLTEVYLSRL